MPTTLRDYQQHAVEWVMARPSSALWMWMGLGKTLVTLTALEQLLDKMEIRRVLVVAPLRVAQTAWPDEINKWGFPYRVQLIRGSPAVRGSQARDDVEVHLINYENLVWLVNEFKDNWRWDCVVLDEAARMKSAKAKRFSALRAVRSKVDRVIELTGTPAANGLQDLWSQVYLMDGGVRLGRSFHGFLQRYFRADFWGHNHTIKPGAAEEIYAKVSDICLSMSAEDYLTLPDKINNVIRVPLPPKAQQIYRRAEKDLVMELSKDVLIDGSSAMGKCLQISNGAVFTEAPAWEQVHDAKLDALEDIVEEAAGQTVLVAYQYTHDRDRILQRFPKAVLLDKDPDTIRRWNAGEIPMLIMHPRSGGEGLNLQDGGNIIAWFGLPWSLSDLLQFNARLHRSGQEKPVFIHYIVGRYTADEDIVTTSLQEKHMTQQDLLHAVKQRLGIDKGERNASS